MSEIHCMARVAALAVLFIGAGFFASPTLADPMEVKVLDGGTAVEGAKVTVRDQNGNEVASGTTKRPNGTQRAPRVTFDLPPGTYTVEATYTDAAGAKKDGKHEDIQHSKKTEVGVFVDPVTTGARPEADKVFEILRALTATEFAARGWIVQIDRPNTRYFRLENLGVTAFPAAKFDNRATGIGGEVSARYFNPNLPRLTDIFGATSRAYLGAGLGYTSADADGFISSVDPAPGLLGLYTPGNGIATGTPATNLRYTARYGTFLFEPTVGWLHGSLNAVWDFFFGGHFQSGTADEKVTLELPVLGRSFTDSRSIKSNAVGPVLGVKVRKEIRKGISIGGGLSVGIDYQWANGKWDADLTGIPTRSAEYSANKWTPKASIDLDLSYRIAPRITVGFGAGYEASRVPFWNVTDANAGDGGTRIDFRYAREMKFGLRGNVEF